MIDREIEAFKAMFEETAAYYDGKLQGLDIWWNSLRKFSFQQVRAAFNEHIRNPEGHFPPKAADIIAIIVRRDGHPSADEAWSMVSNAIADEGVTMVLTEPMRSAFFQAIGASENKIAARMTFKDVYARELADARGRGEPPKWSVSLGQNASGRESVLINAVEKGRITAELAMGLLPHSSGEPDRRVVKLIESAMQRLTEKPES